MQDSIDQKARVTSDWIRYGSYCGFLFAIIFLSVSFLPVPRKLETTLVLILPVLLVVGHVGLYHFLSKHQQSFTNQLAVIFGICAPVLVSAMLTVQMSMSAYMDKYYRPLEESVRASQINIWRAVDSVQLGLDVAWDMFILPAVILFSIGIMKHPAFGKIMGVFGLVFGLLGLVLNIYTFPIPPVETGYMDVGPFIVFWYLVLFGLMIRAQLADRGTSLATAH